METLFDVLPMELINTIFYYIDNINDAFNLIEIPSFEKLLNNISWELLIKEKIGYLYESLDIKLKENSVYKNMFIMSFVLFSRKSTKDPIILDVYVLIMIQFILIMII